MTILDRSKYSESNEQLYVINELNKSFVKGHSNIVYEEQEIKQNIKRQLSWKGRLSLGFILISVFSVFFNISGFLSIVYIINRMFIFSAGELRLVQVISSIIIGLFGAVIGLYTGVLLSKPLIPSIKLFLLGTHYLNDYYNVFLKNAKLIIGDVIQIDHEKGSISYSYKIGSFIYIKKFYTKQLYNLSSDKNVTVIYYQNISILL